MSKQNLPEAAKCLGIGWDVGGWTGRANALAVATWTGQQVHWAATPKREKLPAADTSLCDFVDHFLGDSARGWVEQALERELKVVVGVDAPLGLPKGFVEQVRNPRNVGFSSVPDKYIDNPLAFRDTDRAVARHFGIKQPLTPTFAWIANPVSVARCFTAVWGDAAQGDGFAIAGREDDEHPHEIIEVYPALAKQDVYSDSPPCEGYVQHREDWDDLGADERDAALCALLALGRAWNKGKKLPLMKPCAGYPKACEGYPKEGTIWRPEGSAWSLPNGSR